MSFGNTLFKGTWEDAMNHAGDIPRNQLVLISAVTEEAQQNIENLDLKEANAFGGRSLADIIREIGFVEELPEDLSTNPTYLEGFGKARKQREL